MSRFYEWIKIILQEKINIFFKGATSGWLLAGVLLFGSNISTKDSFIVAYLVKLFAVAVTGVISGFATVFGNDAYKWMKVRVVKRRRTTSKNKRNVTKEKVKRAS